MTAATEHETVSPTECWCCGSSYPETELVRLGNHPEVGICVSCSRWVWRRAVRRGGDQRRSPAALARRVVDRARDAVIRRRWHDRGLLGKVLRRIDRYLP
jgi:hypothetical protein